MQTADFFTPIVDDPYDFGRIAADQRAQRHLRDGRRRRSARSTSSRSRSRQLGGDVLARDPARRRRRRGRGGRRVVGGHSIDDPEPKYGLAVTGTVHPDAVLTQRRRRGPGDALVLTKPLGRRRWSPPRPSAGSRRRARAEAIEVMTTLNDRGAAAARAAGAHALTDVTGFGLLGHLHELALAQRLRRRGRRRARCRRSTACSSC